MKQTRICRRGPGLMATPAAAQSSSVDARLPESRHRRGASIAIRRRQCRTHRSAVDIARAAKPVVTIHPYPTLVYYLEERSTSRRTAGPGSQLRLGFVPHGGQHLDQRQKQRDDASEDAGRLCRGAREAELVRPQ